MIWSNWYRNGQIHPSGFKDAGSCVAQQTRLSLGWTGAKHLSMDLASGPPQQQDSHVFMPHNSTLWLVRIRCVKTLMNCLGCDEICSWLCVDRDQSWCYQPPLFQPWLLVCQKSCMICWHYCQKKPLSVYVTVYFDTD